MFFKNRQMTGNPIVDRMINKRDQTYAEIYALQTELQTLKEVIHSQQKRLRKMNQRIIQRSISQHYLKVVSSQPAWQARETENALKLKQDSGFRRFRCITGGKQA